MPIFPLNSFYGARKKHATEWWDTKHVHSCKHFETLGNHNIRRRRVSVRVSVRVSESNKKNRPNVWQWNFFWNNVSYYNNLSGYGRFSDNWTILSSSSSAIILWWHINNNLLKCVWCLINTLCSITNGIAFIAQSLIMFVWCVSRALFGLRLFMYKQMKSVLLLNIRNEREHLMFTMWDFSFSFHLTLIERFCSINRLCVPILLYLCQNHINKNKSNKFSFYILCTRTRNECVSLSHSRIQLSFAMKNFTAVFSLLFFPFWIIA